MIGVGVAGPTGDDPRSAMPAEDAELERASRLALSLVPGLGPAGFARLVERHGSAAAAWAAGQAGMADLALPAEASAALRDLRRAGVARVARRLELSARAAGSRIVTALDADYPPMLAGIPHPPPVLHLAGDAAALRLRAVAMVGTRRASGYGLSAATEIADELAASGAVVVSGLALGIDGASHRAALAAGGRTVAVLPSSLARVYPPRHASLASDIVAGGGALVSEVAPGRVIGRPDFARRNRIIAALAEAVVVVEAPDRSGALLTASVAAALGREVYAVPGPIDASTARGCNRLIADHQAELVTSASALLIRLRLGPAAAALARARPAPSDLSDPEAAILAHLLRRSGSIEELVDRSHLRPGVVAGALTLLEARGLAESFGGATFHPSLTARRMARTV